jgi:hypothetical protein
VSLRHSRENFPGVNGVGTLLCRADDPGAFTPCCCARVITRLRLAFLTSGNGWRERHHSSLVVISPCAPDVLSGASSPKPETYSHDPGERAQRTTTTGQRPMTYLVVRVGWRVMRFCW